MKTLKDFEKASELPDPENNAYKCYMDLIEDLKQEAIKWIKKYLKEIELHIPELKECPTCGQMKPFCSSWIYEDFRDRRMKINWIKHFFNITEEDLK